MTTTFRTVVVPAYAGFSAESLIEGLVTRYPNGIGTVYPKPALTTGLCRTIEEAQTRAAELDAGRQPRTQAPDYQANEREMAAALAKFETMAIKDGGMCQSAIEAALKAGIHTVEWAIASRYLVAGWV